MPAIFATWFDVFGQVPCREGTRAIYRTKMLQPFIPITPPFFARVLIWSSVRLRGRVPVSSSWNGRPFTGFFDSSITSKKPSSLRWHHIYPHPQALCLPHHLYAQAVRPPGLTRFTGGLKGTAVGQVVPPAPHQSEVPDTQPVEDRKEPDVVARWARLPRRRALSPGGLRQPLSYLIHCGAERQALRPEFDLPPEAFHLVKPLLRACSGRNLWETNMEETTQSTPPSRKGPSKTFLKTFSSPVLCGPSGPWQGQSARPGQGSPDEFFLLP